MMVPPGLIPRSWETSRLREAVGDIPARIWSESVLQPMDTLNCLRHFEPSETRVVILGQDPYPKPGKANGLSFGINPNWTGPVFESSFGNVFREATRSPPTRMDTGFDCTLRGWARQGVLLLNTDLSVAPNKPGSHRGVWQSVVQEIMSQLPAGVVWLAWGARSAKVASTWHSLYTTDVMYTATHPCRYSATRSGRRLKAFVGCDHFGLANRFLREAGHPAIKWNCRREGLG